MTHQDNFNIKKWLNENITTNEIKVTSGNTLDRFKQILIDTIKGEKQRYGDNYYESEALEVLFNDIMEQNDHIGVERVIDEFFMSFDTEDYLLFLLTIYRKALFG